MGGVREGPPHVHQLYEAHQALPGAKIDHAQSEALMEVPGKLAGLHTKIAGQPNGRYLWAPTDDVQDAPCCRVTLLEPALRGAK